MADRSEKSTTAFRTIGEAAEALGVPQHVLRFWETRFSQLQPLKRGGGRRYYRPADMALLETIRAMLHDQGLTIRGAQQALTELKSAPAAPAPPRKDPPVAAAPAPSVEPPALSPAARQALLAIRNRLASALAA
jgi:DNA-binding transcriptional MerR regulator